MTTWPLLLTLVLGSEPCFGWVDHMLSEDESVSDPVEMADTGRDMLVDREASELTDVFLSSFSLWTSTAYFGLRDMLCRLVCWNVLKASRISEYDVVAWTGVYWWFDCLVFWAKTEETKDGVWKGTRGSLYMRRRYCSSCLPADILSSIFNAGTGSEVCVI